MDSKLINAESDRTKKRILDMIKNFIKLSTLPNPDNRFNFIGSFIIKKYKKNQLTSKHYAFLCTVLETEYKNVVKNLKLLENKGGKKSS